MEQTSPDEKHPQEEIALPAKKSSPRKLRLEDILYRGTGVGVDLILYSMLKDVQVIYNQPSGGSYEIPGVSTCISLVFGADAISILTTGNTLFTNLKKAVDYFYDKLDPAIDRYLASHPDKNTSSF